MVVRLLFVVSVLIWVVATVELQPILYLLLCSIFIVRFQGLTLLFFTRSFRLLLWLFVPIFLFHGIFSPGTYIQFPVYLPLSIEGLERALFLCVHIALIFFSAILIFRTLTLSEWCSLLDKLPRADAIKPYMLLMPRLRKRMADTLFEQKQAWSTMHKRWFHLPDILVLSIQKMLVAGKEEANDLWQTWEERVLQGKVETIILWHVKDLLYVGLLVVGWGLMWT